MIYDTREYYEEDVYVIVVKKVLKLNFKIKIVIT